jgi:hypothetical protein
LPVVLLTAYDITEFTKRREVARRITRPPYQLPMLEKGDIGKHDFNDLFVQIEQLVPWDRRPVRCFVIMPFHESFGLVYEQIQRTLSGLNIDCLRADEEHQAGNIPDRVLKHLRHNSLIVADLTGQNPNVLYELGYAHALGRPVILLCQDHDALPQDLSTFRAIQYNVKYSGIQQLGQQLSAAVEDTFTSSRSLPKSLGKFVPVHNTYVKLIPGTPTGETAMTEIIQPVIEELGLQEQATLSLFSQALRIEENWLNLGRAELVVAEISEGDPSVYYHVGMRDALRARCLLLLIRQGVKPPFNLRGRANIVTYDPSNARTAKVAQQTLKQRVLACLGSNALGADEGIDVSQGDSTGDLGAGKREVREALRRIYDEVVRRIDEHGAQGLGDIARMKQYVGWQSEAFLNRIDEARSDKELNSLKEELAGKAEAWYTRALNASLR